MPMPTVFYVQFEEQNWVKWTEDRTLSGGRVYLESQAQTQGRHAILDNQGHFLQDSSCVSVASIQQIASCFFFFFHSPCFS